MNLSDILILFGKLRLFPSVGIGTFKSNRYPLFFSFLFFLPACSQISGFFLKGQLKDEDKKSYVFGYRLGDSIKGSAKDLNQKVFLLGLRHGLEGKQPLTALQKISAPQATKQDQEKNLKEGREFLEKNKQKSGVKVSSSGLQYRVLKEGKGRRPSARDRVEVHYRGTLINGEEFDSSYKRDQTAVFPLNGVIKGWTEGLQLMKEGAKYEFYIPPDLGYGSGGPGKIPPSSVLVFQVELIKIH